MKTILAFLLVGATMAVAQTTNINVGSAANDGTGDTLRNAFTKVNNNDNYLYDLITASGGIPYVNIDGSNVVVGTVDSDRLGASGAAGKFLRYGGTWAVTSEGVSVLDYGAIADDLIDDSVAFQNALNSNSAVRVPPGTYIITNTVITNLDTILIGQGRATLQMPLGSTNTMFTGTNRLSFQNLFFDGKEPFDYGSNSYVTSNRNGVVVGIQSRIAGCDFRGFSGIAITTTGDQGFPTGSGSQYIGDCNTISNFMGIRVQAEYTHVVDTESSRSQYGYSIEAGNVNIVGSSVDYNWIGLDIAGVANNGHGNFVGGILNHCVVSVYGHAITLGFNITGNQIMGGGYINLDGCNDIIFSHNQIDPTSIISNAGTNFFIGNWWRFGGFTQTLTGGAVLHCLGNITGDGVASGMTNTLEGTVVASKYIFGDGTYFTNVTATNAFRATHATNLWGLLSPTNLPAGLSTSNYVGAFAGDGLSLSNMSTIGSLTMATGTVTVATSASTNLFAGVWHYNKSIGGLNIHTNTSLWLTNAGNYLISFGAGIAASSGTLTLQLTTNEVVCPLVFLQSDVNAGVYETGFKEILLALPANARVGLAIGNSAAQSVNVRNICLNVRQVK